MYVYYYYYYYHHVQSTEQKVYKITDKGLNKINILS